MLIFDVKQNIKNYLKRGRVDLSDLFQNEEMTVNHAS